MKEKGAKIIVDTLIEQGVEYVFGYPGGYIIDVFDELYKAKGKIKQVLTCHEQGAAHAADGYARVTGKVGVVMSTSGPGATNLVTGIATAYMDSVPLVAITGNVPLSFLGRDSFQEVDIAGITMPVTKHNYIVKDIAELGDTLREAFKIASSGRPGPVLVDVPKNVQQAEYEFEPQNKEPRKPNPTISDIGAALKIIEDCERPFIYAGGGCVISGAEKELVEFAERLGAPVACSIMGLGCIPASHPLFAGMLGMHGLAGVTESLGECDALIAVGARFSDRVAGDRKGFMPHAKIVHIDIDNAEIDKNVSTHAHISGDVKTVLNALLKKLVKKDNADWAERVREIKAANPLKESGAGLCPRRIISRLAALTPNNQIIATDVGQHQMWTAQGYPFEKPRTFVTSGGLGTMGFGMGAAIGAALGSGRRVCLITGDGSFHMNFNEVITAVKNKLPITVLILNNNVLGMVRQWQTLFYGKRYSSTTLEMPTDYVMLAKAMGADGAVLDKNEDIDTVLEKALSSPLPFIVDCRIAEDEFVLPMIPPGKTMKDMITEL